METALLMLAAFSLGMLTDCLRQLLQVVVTREQAKAMRSRTTQEIDVHVNGDNARKELELLSQRADVLIGKLDTINRMAQHN